MTVELNEEERKALVTVGKWLGTAPLPAQEGDIPFRRAAAIVAVRVLAKVRRKARTK